jgi:hypothetical protein
MQANRVPGFQNQPIAARYIRLPSRTSESHDLGVVISTAGCMLIRCTHSRAIASLSKTQECFGCSASKRRLVLLQNQAI